MAKIANTVCDIVIPVWNQLAFTRDCIRSVMDNTGGIEYRIVIIDNGSDPQTRDYLAGLARSHEDRVVLIRHETNLGFVKAANEGMRASSSPYVCILNNDTLVTKGWLEVMVAIAALKKETGIVNPSSNNLGQRPPAGEAIDNYARRLKGQAAGFVELGSAIGFCMLIKRELIDRIGVFDDVYGMGNFEDTDYSRRAQKEGYLCVRACGAYVYHIEGSSFRKMKSFEEDFRRNREIFEFRWGKPKRFAYVMEECHGDVMKRVRQDSVRLAREGNRLWFFSKEEIDVPEHSNILYKGGSGKRFYLKALFAILKKKKRFDEIFVGSEPMAGMLKWFAIIHRAKINYY